jgi:hypothetical protein
VRVDSFVFIQPFYSLHIDLPSASIGSEIISRHYRNQLPEPETEQEWTGTPWTGILPRLDNGLEFPAIDERGFPVMDGILPGVCKPLGKIQVAQCRFRDAFLGQSFGGSFAPLSSMSCPL